MKDYNFSKEFTIDNRNSNKWVKVYTQIENSDNIVPFSDAEMEFSNPPEIIDGIQEYIRKFPLTYPRESQRYFDSIINWHSKQQQWEIQKDWILTTPDVETSINLTIQTFTNENDGVLYLPPVYSYFKKSIINSNRRAIEVPLILENYHYQIDFRLLEREASKPENKVLLFCSPHSPVGRVWTIEELSHLGRIAKENDIIILSDEIWNEFIFGNIRHSVFSNINDGIYNSNLVICTSPSKTFNISGLKISNLIIPDKFLREKVKEKSLVFNSTPNVLGFEGIIQAYNYGVEWLNEVKKIILENFDLIKKFSDIHSDKMYAFLPEGTYCQWIDFRKLGLNSLDLKLFLENEALLFVENGYIYGKEGEGFVRMNIAVPTSVLKEALSRLDVAFKNIEKYK